MCLCVNVLIKDLDIKKMSNPDNTFIL